METNTPKAVGPHANGDNGKKGFVPRRGGKEDANLRKRGFLHFQIGLILALLLVYLGLEASFKARDSYTTVEPPQIEELAEYHPELAHMQVEQPKTVAPPKVVVNPRIIEVPDEDGVTDAPEFIQTEPDPSPPLSPSDIVVLKEEPDEVLPNLVEQVPVFPGCEKLPNDQRLDCFQQKLQEHIRKNIRYPDAEREMGVKGRVAVLFKVDPNGEVSQIQVKGPSQGLEKEAIRIMEKLPKMKPGMQGGRPVRVPFSIPINFTLQ